MTELSDYKRIVEGPQNRRYEATIAALRVQVDELRTAIADLLPIAEPFARVEIISRAKKLLD